MAGRYSAEISPRKNEDTDGYEYDFTEKIQEKYKCMICHKVQREATITSCCCKHYCKSCLEKWFKKKRKQCPHCRSTSFNHFVNRQQVQDINELMLKCTNHKDGCTWEGKLEDLKKHTEENCDYTAVDCPNKCPEKVLRKKLDMHKKNDCFLRPFKCQHCGKKDTYHAVTGECGKYGYCRIHKGHYKTCGDFPLECPNKCLEKRIKRRNMDSHLEKCPLQPVDCPFKEVGCTTHVVRKNLQSHIDSSDHHHLMLMMTAFKEIKKENAQLKNENGKLRNDIDNINLKLGNTGSSNQPNILDFDEDFGPGLYVAQSLTNEGFINPFENRGLQPVPLTYIDPEMLCCFNRPDLPRF